MSDLSRIYFTLLKVTIKLFVRSKVIPSNLCAENSLSSQQHLLYVLPYDSKIDVLTLRAQCLKKGFPDPLIPIRISSFTLSRYIFVYDRLRLFSFCTKKSKSTSLLYNYLDLHRSNPELDLRLVLVSVMFGRAPGKESQCNQITLQFRILNNIKKLFAVLWLGRDSFVQFSQPISLRDMAEKHGTDKYIVQKLTRIARIHFTRQRITASGPRLPVRRDLFSKLLTSKTIKKAIEDEARSKKISVEKAQQNAIAFMEEIAADFSYETIRLSDRVLNWAWNRLYKELHVCNVERVRKLAEEGHEIVYLPCHRSHIDYLLLSYVLYHQGLVPPHIAAGINLNFWPAGPIFRRLGAFFIRRSFKGKKLYSAIFREYLSELFNRGYSVEYFLEGGRSRTGRLLEPKTGTLSMTVQAMMRGSSRPIMLVPIYIGYEHVMEVATYAKELRGADKEQEGLWQALRGLCKLHNCGRSYVNFGDPLSLSAWLSDQVPHWRNFINKQRPNWLAPVVNNIATILMIRINNAAVVNSINLCATALLASNQRSLTRPQLLSQLSCYLALLRNTPYASDTIVPDLTPETLLSHALAMKKLTIEHDTIGDIIYLSRDQATLITYYRNNIQHLFILPSMVASIICNHPGVTYEQLHNKITLLYPFLKTEFFMHYETQQLPRVIDNFVAELSRQELVEIQKMSLYPIQTNFHTLQLLAANVSETLQRYSITFFLLHSNPHFNRKMLEKESQIIAQRLSILHDINAPEFFDKTIFSTLVATLCKEDYISNTKNAIDKKVCKMCDILSELVRQDVLITIKASV